MATYATLLELKGQLHVDAGDTADDVQLTLALEAATELADAAMGTTGAQLAPVPASVKLATMLQATRLFKRGSSPFGVLGADEFGTFIRLQTRLDPDVELLLGGYGELPRIGAIG